MTSHLHFSIKSDRALDTLEAVLAIARRGGLQLKRIACDAAATEHQVALELTASEPDLLDLFAARLDNLIGVFNITTGESMHVAISAEIPDTAAIAHSSTNLRCHDQTPQAHLARRPRPDAHCPVGDSQ